MDSKFVIGIDYGTDSVRSVLIDTQSGKELDASVFYYPRWKKGLFCDPLKNRFRQHPLDYIEGLISTVKKITENLSAEKKDRITGISIDTTGSTPAPVNGDGTPLALLPDFDKDPDAMFILWKDHTAIKEAEEINKLAGNGKHPDYTQYSGGIYSPEWFWAKILHILRKNSKVRKNAHSWVEHCDWLPALLSGNTDPGKLRRSRCAGGHKALWHPEFGGLPSGEFLTELDPLLDGIRERLYSETYTSAEKAGELSEEWAENLGLSAGISIGVGALDAHFGAVGGEIRPGVMLKIMGTSTCDIIVAPCSEISGRPVRGICGEVDGSVVPGFIGMEAGQGAFGDIYAWFRKLLAWPLELLPDSALISGETAKKLGEEIIDKIIPLLSRQASAVPAGETALIAVDWMNGRRTPDAAPLLKGAIGGLTLGSDAPRIFRALVEATAFGSKRILERFIDEGITINSIIANGGVAKKSPFVMQILADVLNKPVKTVSSDQACSLGAAMFASVHSGIYKDLESAQKAMGSGYDAEYIPNRENVRIYETLYNKYIRFGNFLENGLEEK